MSWVLLFMYCHGKMFPQVQTLKILSSSMHSIIKTFYTVLSVTTTHLSTIVINPPMAESVTLKQWYIDHKEEVNHQLELKVYENPEFLLPLPKESEIISAHSALKNLQTLKTAWIRGKAVLAYGQTSYWFTSCHNCKKGFRAQVGWIMTCPQCKAEGPMEPRCRFTLGIEDNTGLIQAVISSLEAEQLLPMTAAQMSLNKNQLENSMEIEANFEKKKKKNKSPVSYISDYQDKNESSFAVVVVYVNEDNVEDILYVDETNTYVHPHRLGKQSL